MIKLCVLIFVSMTACSYAAVAIYPYEPKPAEFADKDGCFIGEWRMVLPYNKPVYPKDGKSCVRLTCGTNNQTELVSCGAYGLSPDCHLEKDFTLDYPKCCGTVVCDATTTTTTEGPTEETCITVTAEPTAD